MPRRQPLPEPNPKPNVNPHHQPDQYPNSNIFPTTLFYPILIITFASPYVHPKHKFYLTPRQFPYCSELPAGPSAGGMQAGGRPSRGGGSGHPDPHADGSQGPTPAKAWGWKRLGSGRSTAGFFLWSVIPPEGRPPGPFGAWRRTGNIF